MLPVTTLDVDDWSKYPYIKLAFTNYSSKIKRIEKPMYLFLLLCLESKIINMSTRK